MTRSTKIAVLWLLTICGFACHILCDVLPMFWGKDMAMMATDGNVDQGMIVFMMALSFLVPACGIFCLMSRRKYLKIANAVLALFLFLLSVAHTFMELPFDNAGMYVIMPIMIIIGFQLSRLSIEAFKEDEAQEFTKPLPDGKEPCTCALYRQGDDTVTNTIR